MGGLAEKKTVYRKKKRHKKKEKEQLSFSEAVPSTMGNDKLSPIRGGNGGGKITGEKEGGGLRGVCGETNPTRRPGESIFP